MDIAFEHKIRQRAYEIWMASGMNDGEAESHWHHAERAVCKEAEATAISIAVPKQKAKATKAAVTKGVAIKATKTKATKTKTEAAAVKATAKKAIAAPHRVKTGPVEAVA